MDRAAAAPLSEDGLEKRIRSGNLRRKKRQPVEPTTSYLKGES